MAVETATSLFSSVGPIAATAAAVAAAALVAVVVEEADYLLMMAMVVTLIEYVALGSVAVAALTECETKKRSFIECLMGCDEVHIRTSTYGDFQPFTETNSP